MMFPASSARGRSKLCFALAITSAQNGHTVGVGGKQHSCQTGFYLIEVWRSNPLTLASTVRVRLGLTVVFHFTRGERICCCENLLRGSFEYSMRVFMHST